MMRQVRAEKANASEPLLKCRKRAVGIGTGVGSLPRDESGGCLRSWPGGVRHEGGASSVQAPVRNVGTPRRDAADGRVEAGRCKGGPPGSWNCEGQSTGARQGGGSPRGSGEASVMGVERRGRVVLVLFGGRPEFPGGAR
jgi:hypothetical protein